MAKFNVGDIIRVKDWEIVKNTIGAIRDMREFVGRVGKISQVLNRNTYYITVDNERWYWNVGALELCDDDSKSKHLKAPYNWIDLIEKGKIGTL